MKYILALDQGTTSSRAVLFAEDGQPVASAQKEFTQIFPQPGWVEHDPLEIWSSQSAVIAEALAAGDIRASELAGIGITNQRETTTVWDRQTGQPVYNAIVWQDRRTAPECDALRAEGAEGLIREKTGLVIDPYFSAMKIRWILDNVPGARQRAEQGHLAFGTVDTWLLWKLTGGRRHATDVTNASRTMLMNLADEAWDEELLKLARVPRSMMPEICPSSHMFGSTRTDLLSARVPIAGIAGDQHAALFGHLCFSAGMAKNTYGTGCFLLMNTGRQPTRSENQLLTTAAWKLDGTTEYALEGSVFVAGAVVQWLRDGLRVIRHAAEADALAATVPDSGGVLFVPAFTGLGAPHWDAHARGTIVGITRGTTSGHLARAALEAIAFQTAEVLRAMERDSGVSLRELRVDGGAVRSDLLLQFQADLLGVPVLRPQRIETTVAGAAYLAGLAVGVWRNRKDIAELWSLERRFEPQQPREQMRDREADWRRAVERAKGWAV